MVEKVKCTLQWQKVTYKETIDSQWQKVNRGIPQRQKVEYWYPIRIVLKGRWDINWFKNLPKQTNLFFTLGVTYVFVTQKSNQACFHILHHFIDELTYI